MVPGIQNHHEASCDGPTLHTYPTSKNGGAGGGAAHLTRNGESLCGGGALDGMHGLCKLVGAQVGEARDGASGTPWFGPFLQSK
jgi:hypothetical protein